MSIKVCQTLPYPDNSPEARIAIAKDVLRHLRYTNVFSRGYYFSPNHNIGIKNLDINAQKIMPKLRKCGVCAIGSIFLSYINLFNSVKTGEINRWCCKDYQLDILEKYFDKNQLNLIEVAFERTTNQMTYTESLFHKNETINKAKHFCSFCDDKKNLRQIMLNIVKNKGEFIP